MNNGDRIFAESIKHLREERGLTQEELAEIIGVRKTTISNYEIQYSTPNLSILKRLTAAFDLPITYFTSSAAICEKKEIQNTFGNSFPYYYDTNIKGILTGKLTARNSIVTLPKNFLTKGAKYICTRAPDNSMNKCNIHIGDFVIINTSANIESGKIVAVVYRDILQIRRFVNKNSTATLVAESTKIPISLSVKELTDDMNIIGVVEKIMLDLCDM